MPETDTPIQYLRISGRLYPDLRLVLRPGYLTEQPRAAHTDREPEGRARVELYDDTGTLRLRYPLATVHRCSVPRTADVLSLKGEIPFPAGTRLLRFYYDDVLLQEVAVSPRGPQVDLRWNPGEEAAGTHRITWDASHPGGQTLQFFLRYSHDAGRSWQRISLRTAKTEVEIDFDHLPGGEDCRLAVVATDGVNTATSERGPFRVAVKGCRPMLFSPPEGARFVAGEAVPLRGQGFWLEERRPETEDLRWRSSIDGELGTGPVLDLPLSPGEHEISLEAGEGLRAGRVAIRITVLEADTGSQGKAGLLA